ncbi:hypothetical protein M8C13_00030 [Crossiella sp. SN42]|uniref:hypothetical protein n=1 Tax=Crossiella sp. SN42 TaxID=2944808 RepID=UPI00207D6B8C|nr:hypothetical protein [Crossiella sp. SN42]MCO1574145.1 hypothetical protein [Crossiella sp. SN42]
MTTDPPEPPQQEIARRHRHAAILAVNFSGMVAEEHADPGVLGCDGGVFHPEFRVVRSKAVLSEDGCRIADRGADLERGGVGGGDPAVAAEATSSNPVLRAAALRAQAQLAQQRQTHVRITLTSTDHSRAAALPT